jgi:pimeloyl-ACP methyl ester carboxylesterase
MLCVDDMRPPQHGRIRVADDIELAIQDFGGDGPLVILHHAVGFCAGVWTETARLLLPDFHVIALDARGHGASSKPSDPAAYQWANFAADLCVVAETLLERFGGDSVPLAVGHSFGGTCTLGAASRRPALFQRVLTLDPVLVRMPSDGDAQKAPPGNPGERSKSRTAVFSSFEAALAGWQGKALFQTWHPAVLRDYVFQGLVQRSDGQVELRCSPETEVAVFGGARGYDVFPMADQVTALTRIYWAERGSFSLETYRALAKLIPRAEVGTVPTGHLVPMERPDLAAALIRELATEVPATPGGRYQH